MASTLKVLNIAETMLSIARVRKIALSPDGETKPGKLSDEAEKLPQSCRVFVRGGANLLQWLSNQA